MDFRKDLSGLTYGRWKVLSYSHKVLNRTYWNCICECGTEKAVPGAELKRSASLSCGCLMRELASTRSKTHGMTKHPAFTSWRNAKGRCRNPENDAFYLYGGRGIEFSEEWDTFEAFWSEMGPSWEKGKSLDRIDYDGHYEPGNCRWATPKEQANNRSTNHLIETDKGWMNVTEAADYFGISPVTLFARLRYGWTHDQLSRPVRQRKEA